MYGPGRGASAGEEPHGRPQSEYVKWVLSKSQRVRGVPADQGDLVDTLTGRKQTADEDAHDFFGALYEMSTWRQPALAVPRPADMLRRLGLVPHQPPNLSRTVGVVLDTLNKLQAARKSAADLKAETGSVYGLRSHPPTVPAPPTLAPEPLMLSPLQELPYLFALEAPELPGLLMEGGPGAEARARQKKKTNRVQATKEERVRLTGC